MKFTAGKTVTIKVRGATLIVKIEDASKGDTLSAKVEEMLSGEGYEPGRVYEFKRDEVASL